MKPYWKDFGIFYLLSFLLLAFVPVTSLLFGVSMDFSEAGNRAAEQTGIPWTSNLVTLCRLALVEPGLFLLIFGAAVPTLAALVTLLVRRRFSIKKIGMRLLPAPGKQAAGISIAVYVVLFIFIAICLLVTGWIRRTWLPEIYVDPFPALSAGLVLAVVGGALLDQGALLEEGGWRGFATSWLQENAVTPLKVALIVGVCWGLWHLPRDIVSGLPGQLGITTYILMYLPAFLMGTISVSVVASYFMNRLGGSIWPAILIHGLVNDAAGISGFADINIALTPMHQITNALPMFVLAVLLVFISGRQLGYRPPRKF